MAVMKHCNQSLKTRLSPSMRAKNIQICVSYKGLCIPVLREKYGVAQNLVVKQHSSEDDKHCSHLKTLARAFAGACLSAALIATPMTLNVPGASADAGIIRLPASTKPEIFAVQQTLMEAWSIVGETFVDEHFNGRNWPAELKEHMMAAFNAPAPEAAVHQLDDMLASLGDPYTRHISSQDYQSFRVSTDGELQGVGLLIANQMSQEGHLLVLAPIKGGPADRAGVLPGDEVVTIDGKQTRGMNEEAAAQLLRGKGGTEVRVMLARQKEQVPGDAGISETAPKVLLKEVSLKRERVNLSPVYYTALNKVSSSNAIEQERGKDDQLLLPSVGYVRLTQFSSNAADDMRAAVKDLESQGVEEYILDLRSNPGGLVSAGIDVASIWLDGKKPVFNIQGREGDNLLQTTQDESPALTHAPLAVLVDQNSASASEILTGALRDNQRAKIIGDSHTYGKGKIQTVYELNDGSALFVTVAKYKTPKGTEIDHRGLSPDSSCHPMSMNTMLRTRPRVMIATSKLTSTAAAGARTLPAAAAAAGFSPGLPIGPQMEEALVKQLTKDSCVLAAEHILDEKVQKTPGWALMSLKPHA
ncbi:hypothetical protein CEUSTIGMA_g4353.t1 [Chlamydomonas eustigma]|uniref:PDZ domain-containing protein n=1 Tax=Chlamydomonas eustigma TaxID=1157962 RepID=A0A250X1F2_9CHLO|nr:hypothetical protein CEUSTIGMA_g4353.t1 [Chlamydomonas eustigma]|eukprot:GAX76907.1 hypothetical protein CEUSTIGMA_g4353.t1 [Chlamydomonas eustigma]